VADQKLVEQIAQESKELKEAPKVPLIVGQVRRCHICGQPFNLQQLKPFDTHIPGRIVREACPTCHPDRGTL